MKKNLLFLFISLFFIYNIYSISINHSLSDSLNKNADAIVLQDSTVMVVNDKGYIVSNYMLVKLNNPNLVEDFTVVLYNSLDNNSTLIKGNIYDANGRLIKKIKKQDFTTIGDLSNFSSDVTYEFYQINEVQYPIYLETEITYNSKTLFILPSWNPIPTFNCALQHASLTISATDSSLLRYYAINKMSEVEQQFIGNNYQWKWQLNNIKAFIDEEKRPKINQIFPTLLLAPTQIVYNKYKSNFYTWQDLGNWIKQLNNNKDILPESLKKELHTLTDTMSSDFEKAKAIYNYMQKHTRYLSIQYGIGGFQPFDAAYVYNKGFGDCKALSNYMYALLKEVGIKAYYTLVKAGENNDIEKSFPASQFNHVILCLPLGEDTLWLENTAQDIPFGFNGSFTADRDVLVIADTPFITHTNIYSIDDNLFELKGKAVLVKNNTFDLDFNLSIQGEFYNYINAVYSITEPELRKKYLKEIMHLSNASLTIDSVDVKETVIPTYDLYLKSTINNLNKTTTKRIFVPAILFNQTDTKIKRKDRVQPIFEATNYTDKYVFDIMLPNGYELENQNNFNESFENKVGKYSISINIINSQHAQVERVLVINKYLYNANEFPEYFEFYDKIKSLENSYIEVKVVE